jgi:hypothetical protein
MYARRMAIFSHRAADGHGPEFAAAKLTFIGS